FKKFLLTEKHKCMESQPDKITLLLKKLEELSQRQTSVSAELNDLREEALRLLNSVPTKTESKEVFGNSSEPAEIQKLVPGIEQTLIPPSGIQKQDEPKQARTQPAYPANAVKSKPKKKSDLEKFIGENLINKIGIIITVIGVAIGAKYSIEHDL